MYFSIKRGAFISCPQTLQICMKIKENVHNDVCGRLKYSITLYCDTLVDMLKTPLNPCQATVWLLGDEAFAMLQ